MKKLFILSLLVVIAAYHSLGQTATNVSSQAIIDSMHKELSVATADTTKIKIWTELSNVHKFSRPDSGIYYATKAISLSRSIGYVQVEVRALVWLSISYRTLGDHAKALRVSREALRVAGRLNDEGMALAAMN